MRLFVFAYTIKLSTRFPICLHAYALLLLSYMFLSTSNMHDIPEFHSRHCISQLLQRLASPSLLLSPLVYLPASMPTPFVDLLSDLLSSYLYHSLIFVKNVTKNQIQCPLSILYSQNSIWVFSFSFSKNLI